jgi:PPP family 3-phenylpropionic acid transporter
MGKGQSLTGIYSCEQTPFWMSLCVFSSFCAVYLQSLGYSNAELGIVMACGTLAGSLLGPWLSSLIDQSDHDRITAVSTMPPVLALEALAIVILLVFPVRGIVTSVAFAAFTALATSVNSINLKLYTDAVYSGYSIDYGMARSMGSLGYVLTSFAVGFMCQHISARAVPVTGLVICILQYVTFRNFARYVSSDAPGEKAEQGEGHGMMAFLMRNKRFCLILAATVLVFFAHNTLCNFFINVVKNAGGDTGDMGILNGLMAFFEMPAIFFYSRITRGRRTSAILRFAFIMFTVKAAALAAAASVGQIAAAEILQAPSFGLYSGAIVLYVDEVIPHEDSAKAQSLAFTMSMLASVFASTISGHLYDIMPVSRVLWISCAVSLVGSIFAVIGVRKTSR